MVFFWMHDFDLQICFFSLYFVLSWNLERKKLKLGCFSPKNIYQLLLKSLTLFTFFFSNLTRLMFLKFASAIFFCSADKSQFLILIIKMSVCDRNHILRIKFFCELRYHIKSFFFQYHITKIQRFVSDQKNETFFNLFDFELILVFLCVSHIGLSSVFSLKLSILATTLLYFVAKIFLQKNSSKCVICNM